MHVATPLSPVTAPTPVPAGRLGARRVLGRAVLATCHPPRRRSPGALRDIGPRALVGRYTLTVVARPRQPARSGEQVGTLVLRENLDHTEASPDPIHARVLGAAAVDLSAFGPLSIAPSPRQQRPPALSVLVGVTPAPAGTRCGWTSRGPSG